MATSGRGGLTMTRTHATRELSQAPVEAPRAPAEDVERVTTENAGEWLDEIDATLEENAVEFLQSYRQRGGE